MSMLNKVKLAIRITHSKLDSEINENIDAAKEELERAGVPRDIATEPEKYPLVARAIKTYCQSMAALDQNQADKFMDSFKYQADNLRKSTIYGGAGEDGERCD